MPEFFLMVNILHAAQTISAVYPLYDQEIITGQVYVQDADVIPIPDSALAVTNGSTRDP